MALELNQNYSDANDFNPRNELRLPLTQDVNVERLHLDLKTPRIMAAMKNLGVQEEDLRMKPMSKDVEKDIARMRF